MASTLPVQAGVKSNASLVKLLAPPTFLLLLLFLLLSLLSLLHIHDLLSHSLSTPPLFHFLPPLLFVDTQTLLFHLLHFQQHYLAFLLSPCCIFILANLIVFTLFLSVYFSSSASPSHFVPHTFVDYGDAASLRPEHALPSHDDFFLASPPHQPFVLSQDPPEDYRVLSFDTNYDESTYYRNVQSYNKLSNTWEKVKGVSINPSTTRHIINGVIAQKEVKKPDKLMMTEKVQSMPTVEATPAYKVLNVDQGKVVEKGLRENRLEEKASRSTKAAAAYSSPGSQVVVIDMELAPASRHTLQASHPPLVPLAPLPQPAKVAPLPLNKSNMSVQRPPSSPRVKKSSQSTGSSANDGRYEASRPIRADEKQAYKPSKLQKKPSSMVRSHSDQRLSQRDPSTEVTTVLTSPSSFTSRPHMQRAQSLRSSTTSNTATNVLTSSSSSISKPPIMLRAQSLRDNGTPYMPNSPSQGQVTRSPSSSASLDGLSDAEANKRFSDFIAHRFALMKKERD